MTLVLGFAAGFLGSIPIAGPLSIMVFGRAVQGRAREALALSAGGALAEGLYAAAAFWGLSTLLDRYPSIVPISRLLATLILLLLGTLFLGRPASAPSEALEANPKRGGNFVLGFLLVGLNPTLIATWTAAVTALHASGGLRFEPREAPAFAGAAALGIVCWFALLLALVGRLRHRFRRSSLDRAVQWLGMLLLLLGCWFGVQLVLDLYQGKRDESTGCPVIRLSGCSVDRTTDQPGQPANRLTDQPANRTTYLMAPRSCRARPAWAPAGRCPCRSSAGPAPAGPPGSRKARRPPAPP
jgi:threonine/homoserine/homoserine lactone efflux protein